MYTAPEFPAPFLYKLHSATRNKPAAFFRGCGSNPAVPRSQPTAEKNWRQVEVIDKYVFVVHSRIQASHFPGSLSPPIPLGSRQAQILTLSMKRPPASKYCSSIGLLFALTFLSATRKIMIVRLRSIRNLRPLTTAERSHCLTNKTSIGL